MNKANHQAESYDVDIKYLHIDQSHHVNNNISREYASHNKSFQLFLENGNDIQLHRKNQMSSSFKLPFFH